MNKTVLFLFLASSCGEDVYVTQKSLDCCQCASDNFCTTPDVASCAEALDGEGAILVRVSCLETFCDDVCSFVEIVGMRP